MTIKYPVVVENVWSIADRFIMEFSTEKLAQSFIDRRDHDRYRIEYLTREQIDNALSEGGYIDWSLNT